MRRAKTGQSSSIECEQFLDYISNVDTPAIMSIINMNTKTVRQIFANHGLMIAMFKIVGGDISIIDLLYNLDENVRKLIQINCILHCSLNVIQHIYINSDINPNDSTLHHAFLRDDTQIMDFLISNYNIQMKNNYFVSIKSVQIFNYIRSKCNIPANICDHIVATHNTQILEHAISLGYSVQEATIANIVWYDNLDMLKLLIELGKPMPDTILLMADEYGAKKIDQFLRSQLK